MEVHLKPELERFVDEQVRAGRFASRAEMLEAGIARLMWDVQEDVLDAQDIADIRESLEQLKRGEVVDWVEFSAPMRQKYMGR